MTRIVTTQLPRRGPVLPLPSPVVGRDIASGSGLWGRSSHQRLTSRHRKSRTHLEHDAAFGFLFLHYTHGHVFGEMILIPESWCLAFSAHAWFELVVGWMGFVSTDS